MLSKNKRIIDKKSIESIRKIGYCEYCGSMSGLQVHHIKSRGAGGGDIDVNLVVLCYVCHREVHDGNISRDKLREIVSKRDDKYVN
jgi:5-methylcytosine-specific restriction endonuclease McrA